MCCQLKRLAMVASMTMPDGETGLQDGVTSVVVISCHADVVVVPLFAVTFTRHSIVPDGNVFAGTVQAVVAPETLIVFEVLAFLTRHSKTAEVCFISAKQTCESAVSSSQRHVNIFFSNLFTKAPAVGANPSAVIPTVSSEYSHTNDGFRVDFAPNIIASLVPDSPPRSATTKPFLIPCCSSSFFDL